MDDPAYLDGVLAKGNAKARDLAQPTLDEVRNIMGFVAAS